MPLRNWVKHRPIIRRVAAPNVSTGEPPPPPPALGGHAMERSCNRCQEQLYKMHATPGSLHQSLSVRHPRHNTVPHIMQLLSCVVAVALVALTAAQESFEAAGVRLALKTYDDCAKTDDGLSPCLKKKALAFLDRLGRADRLALLDGVKITRAAGAADPALSEEQLDASLPRAADARDAALTALLADKLARFVGSRTIEVTLPKLSDFAVEEGRKKSGGGGGGMKGMMGGMMMGIAAKLAALVPIAIAGLFLLAGKALITAKIALLLSGIIAIKKLFAQKHGGHGGGHGGWQSSGGGGGWQSSGGGWDKRSFEENQAQKLAYKAYSPK